MRRQLNPFYTILSPEGDRKVEFYRFEDGTFEFQEWYWSENPLERCWLPALGSRRSICGTEDIAWREALGSIPWLKAVVKAE